MGPLVELALTLPNACSVYMVTGGSAMQRVWGFYKSPGSSFGLSAWIIVFFGIQLVLSLVRDTRCQLTIILPPYI